MTCSCILDYNTVAAADKFGNIAIVCTLHVVQEGQSLTSSPWLFPD